VLFEGKRAAGVEYRLHDQTVKSRAVREVILCAGAVNTPQLLQLSGIGPGNLLKSKGIDILHDTKTGRHLQDHVCVDFLYKSRVPTLNDQLHSWRGKLLHGARYLLTRRGPLSLGVNQARGERFWSLDAIISRRIDLDEIG